MKNTILGCAVLGHCLLTNEKNIEQAVEEAWQTANALEETKTDLDFENVNLINVHVCLMIAYLASDKKEEGETTCLLKQHQEFYRAANKLQDLEEVSLKQKAIALLLLQLMIDDDKKGTVFCGDAAKKMVLIERVSFLNKTLAQYLNRSQGKPYVSLTILWSKFNPTLSSRVLSLSDQDKQKDPCTRAIEACEKLKQAQQARIVAIDGATTALKKEFARLEKEIEAHYANILAQELARIDAQTAEIKRKSKKQLEKSAMASLAAIGVTVATHGATKELAASIVTKGTVQHVAVTAGISALIAKTTASMVMHNGNIERVASELVSTDTLKTTVTAMVSAGLLHQACKALDIPLDFADRKEIEEHLNYNLAKACINAGVNVSVNHQDPDKALFLLAFNTPLDTIVDVHTKTDVSDTTRIAMHTGAGYVSGLAAHVNPGQTALESFIGATVSSCTGVSDLTETVFEEDPKEKAGNADGLGKRETAVRESNKNVVEQQPKQADKKLQTQPIGKSESANNSANNREIIIKLSTDSTSGHVYMRAPVADKTGNITEANIGFYPDTTKEKDIRVMVSRVPAKIVIEPADKDIGKGEKHLVTQTLRVTERQYQQLAENLRQAVREPGSYNLLGIGGHNCLSFIDQQLKAIGIVDGLSNKFDIRKYEQTSFAPVQVQTHWLFDQYKAQETSVACGSESIVMSHQCEKQLLPPKMNESHQQTMQRLEDVPAATQKSIAGNKFTP